MKTILTTALLALALPAFAGDPPPAKSDKTWEVWGFKMIDGQWIKQDDHCLKTPDIKQATDYYNELGRVPGWCATTNVPGLAATAADDGGSAAIDSRFIAALVDSADLDFHGSPAYSRDPNDPVNGYNTLHRPGVENTSPYSNGYYGYGSHMGYYRHYYAGPRGGISIRVRVR